MLHKRFYLAISSALLSVTLGCGGSDANLPPLVPVTGTITMDGKALESASVTFIPVGATRGNGATGYTDSNGKYELATPGGDKGAPVGQYKVLLSKMVMPDGSPYRGESGVAPMDSPAREVLPAKYSDYDQTILKATVPEGGGEVNLQVKLTP